MSKRLRIGLKWATCDRLYDYPYPSVNKGYKAPESKQLLVACPELHCPRGHLHCIAPTIHIVIFVANNNDSFHTHCLLSDSACSGEKITMGYNWTACIQMSELQPITEGRLSPFYATSGL